MPESESGYVCVGPLSSERFGQAVETISGSWVQLGKAVLGVDDGETLVFVNGADSAGWMADNSRGDAAGLVDARVMSIQRDRSGVRWRNFRDSAQLLTESEWDAFPVRGPRTLLWCCKFIAEHSLHPAAHHTKWLHMTGLPGTDGGAQEHELALRALDFAVCYDQLQAAEIASLEVLVRRAQMVELKHRDKVVGTGSTGSVDDDSFLYLGTSRTRGLLMISPSLEEWVAGELAKETAAAKERRKMREERAAAKGPPQKK